MSFTMYGIANCDTVAKARKWLEGRGIVHKFHDYKKGGADAERLKSWCAELGWEALLNRGGTTFKKLSEDEKSNIDQTKAIALMMAQPSMIKRPVLEYPGGLLVGFKGSDWEAALG